MLIKNKLIMAMPFFLISLNAYSCNNVISSNIMNEEFAVSDNKKVAISPWPIIELNTTCKTPEGWNIATSIGFKEDGDGDLLDITNPHLAHANILISKGNYKLEVGSYENNFSFNSVFGLALAMRTIPSIQLDVPSYLQTVSSDVNLIRLTNETEFASLYMTAYLADEMLEDESNLDQSFNIGISKKLGSSTNIELQYANESTDSSDFDKKRVSLFMNTSGTWSKKVDWILGAEINTFENRLFTESDRDTTANLFTEVSKTNLLPNINAYISAGAAFDKQNITMIETGAFLNMSTFLKLKNNISILAGAAQSYTKYDGEGSISTSRYSLQLQYKL